MTETDHEVPDENGLTQSDRRVWQMYYVAITNMAHLALCDAGRPSEAIRRVSLLELELRAMRAAVELTATTCGDQWAPDVPPPPATATANTEDRTHG